MAKIKVPAKELYYDTVDGDYYVLNPDGTYDPVTADGAILVTLKTLIAGEAQAEDVLKTEQRFDYEIVAASQTAQVLGGSGAIGDFLHRVVISVNTSATGTCSIDDGAGTNTPLTAANTPIGIYSVGINAKTVTGAWRVTTGAGATALAVGRFT